MCNYLDCQKKLADRVGLDKLAFRRENPPGAWEVKRTAGKAECDTLPDEPDSVYIVHITLQKLIGVALREI
jgi:hypothetical protein